MSIHSLARQERYFQGSHPSLLKFCRHKKFLKKGQKNFSVVSANERLIKGPRPSKLRCEPPTAGWCNRWAVMPLPTNNAQTFHAGFLFQEWTWTRAPPRLFPDPRNPSLRVRAAAAFLRTWPRMDTWPTIHPRNVLTVSNAPSPTPKHHSRKVGREGPPSPVGSLRWPSISGKMFY